MRDYNTIPFRRPRGTTPTKELRTEPTKAPPILDEDEEPKKTDSTSSTAASSSLAAADALAVRREGAEATIARLRKALVESSSREATDKANLAKSDAALVELRSSVRTLKRQLHSSTPTSINTNPNSTNVGELQIQLDRAHAQMLTADMIRKELEDTLEAEQYTWELRTADQERQIAALQQECAHLQAHLEQVQEEWKETQDRLENQVRDLQQGNHGDDSRLVELEKEREELQACLDEALKELEAVDAELQEPSQKQEKERLERMLRERDQSLLEPLQHLYRFLLEQDGVINNNKPQTEQELLAAITSHLDLHYQSSPPQDTNLVQRVKELESQVSVCQGDLRAREERNAELRVSLKEAVGLLKPLQDAASKADREKQKLRNELDEVRRQDQQELRDEIRSLQRSLENKDDQILELKQETETLEIQLGKARLATASQIAAQSQASASASTPSPTVSRIRARRAAEQQTLQTLLKDTQTRISSLNVPDAQRHLQLDETATGRDVGVGVQNAQQALNDEMQSLKAELARKEAELQIVQSELEQARDDDQSRSLLRVEEIEGRLENLQEELMEKRQKEKELGRSLKEALNLLRPLQRHLEEAEEEKKQLTHELDTLKRQRGGNQRVQVLQLEVEKLEQENSQLHNALEDASQHNVSQMSGIGAGDARLREEIVELKSRYEVTQNRLQQAMAENRSLAQALQGERRNGAARRGV